MVRRARNRELDILTTVRMPFEGSGILFRVAVTNHGEQTRTAELSIILRTAIREYSQTWHWDPPRPEEDESKEFEARIIRSQNRFAPG